MTPKTTTTPTARRPPHPPRGAALGGSAVPEKERAARVRRQSLGVGHWCAHHPTLPVHPHPGHTTHTHRACPPSAVPQVRQPARQRRAEWARAGLDVDDDDDDDDDTAAHPGGALGRGLRRGGGVGGRGGGAWRAGRPGFDAHARGSGTGEASSACSSVTTGGGGGAACRALGVSDGGGVPGWLGGGADDGTCSCRSRSGRVRLWAVMETVRQGVCSVSRRAALPAAAAYSCCSLMGPTAQTPFTRRAPTGTVPRARRRLASSQLTGTPHEQAREFDRLVDRHLGLRRNRANPSGTRRATQSTQQPYLRQAADASILEANAGEIRDRLSLIDEC